MLRKMIKKFFKLKWVQYLLLSLVWLYIVVAGKTAKYSIMGQEKLQDFKKSGQPIVLALWHGKMIPPMYYLRNRGIHVLASSHRSSAWAFHFLLQRLGWCLIRGTSQRGGARALIEMVRKLKEGADIIITPDGPSGPVYKLKPGIIYLAQKTGAPIIPLGIASYPGKALKSWDRFLLPSLFGHAVLIFGEPFLIEKDLSEEEVIKRTSELENILNQLQVQAEQTAVTRS